jgi:hypothetical protein
MHELEELPADPSADRVELSGGRFWIVEVCDSVVDWSYTRLNEQRPHRAVDHRSGSRPRNRSFADTDALSAAG